MNKYLISVDIEGITGVISKDFSSANGKYHELAKRYMLSDTNAVIEGILSADSNAYIVVRDAHGDAANLDLERLHPQAHLLQGWGNAANMLESLDDTYKGVFLVGYHAGGQNNEAVLGHCYSSFFQEVRINDKLLNEAGLAALYAGAYDVPIAFISGDDQTIAEASIQFGEEFANMISVVVKDSYGRDSALSMPLNKARILLSKGAKKAISNLLDDKVKPFKMQAPFRVAIKFYNVGYLTSVYRKICGVLEFDKSYGFDKEQFVISYNVDSPLEAFYRLLLIVGLIYGVR